MPFLFIFCLQQLSIERQMSTLHSQLMTKKDLCLIFYTCFQPFFWAIFILNISVNSFTVLYL